MYDLHVEMLIGLDGCTSFNNDGYSFLPMVHISLAWSDQDYRLSCRIKDVKLLKAIVCSACVCSVAPIWGEHLDVRLK